MGNHYDLNIDDINIDQWSRFLSNNDAIERKLDTCCSNVDDIVANVNTIIGTIPSVNSELSKLQTVHVNSLPALDYLLNDINSVVENLKHKAAVIVGGLHYSELAIEALNKGETPDQSAKDLFNSILDFTSDNNLYWLLYEVSRNTKFEALGFLFAYGTDIPFDDGHFVVGDGAKHLFKLATDIWFEDYLPTAWTNLSVGTAAVVLFSAALEIVRHKGDWDTKDYELVIAKAVESGLSYAEWVYITEIALAGAGVGGVVVAALLAVPTSMLWNIINDFITGENVVYTFERNGIEYKITSNGDGPDGTFDVITSEYRNSIRDFYIGDRLCSETEYKERLYTDLENFIYEDTGQKFGEIGDFIAGKTFVEALNVMAEYDTFEEGYDAYCKYLENDVMYGVDADVLSTLLIIDYGFDFQECYNLLRKYKKDGA